MPLINDQYVNFDPDVLARAFAEGHNVQPDFFDYEDEQTMRERILREQNLIDRSLWKNHRNYWNRFHQRDLSIDHPSVLPENLQPYPQVEWKKLENMANIGNDISSVQVAIRPPTRPQPAVSNITSENIKKYKG